MGTTGLQSNNGDAATVSIGMSNGPQNLPPDPTVFGDGVVQKIYLNENAPQVYAVIARLTDENGYVVLESGGLLGGEYRIFYKVRSCCRGACKSSSVRTQCQ